MTRAAARFGWAALFVAWALDQLFWMQTAGGLSFPLWVAIALIVGMLLARSQKIRPAPVSLGLLAAALVFACMTFIRRESFTLFISTLLSFFALAYLAATFRTGNWIYYRIGDFLKSGLHLILAMIIRGADLFTRKPVPVVAGGNDPAALPVIPIAPAPPSTWNTARQHAMPVVRGLLLALPIVLVLGGLLAAADPVFNNWMYGLLKVFDLAKLPEYFFRLFYIVIIAYVLAGIYLHSIQPETLEARPQPDSRWFKPFLGWTEAVVVLAAVNLMFLVFVGIQFWYLFGGQGNISTTGFTYSEYARRGFNELIMVAVLSLLLYLGLGLVTRQETALQQKVWKALNILIMAQVLVILASSFSRLQMYENAYGFTQLRTYTHILIIWLAILLAAVIGLEVTGLRHRFALAGVLVAFGFGLTFGILNVDGFIASQNIQRAWGDSKLDGQYLTVLSEDAVPTLLSEFQRPNQPPAIKEILGAELSCRAELAAQARKASSSWLSYNLSQATADQLLQSNQALWKDYPIQSLGRDGLSVKLSTGVHNCRFTKWLD
jgi:hypothetical protein